MLTINDIVSRWENPETRPLFKGALIDADGCYCAQGDVLHCAGFTDQQLRDMTQSNADREVAKLLGISRAHAVLLRIVNDRQDGCPQDVLVRPEKVLGDKAHIVLAFWRYLDSLGDGFWGIHSALRVPDAVVLRCRDGDGNQEPKFHGFHKINPGPVSREAWGIPDDVEEVTISELRSFALAAGASL